jgi:hypothetical protein
MRLIKSRLHCILILILPALKFLNFLSYMNVFELNLNSFCSHPCYDDDLLDRPFNQIKIIYYSILSF